MFKKTCNYRGTACSDSADVVLFSKVQVAVNEKMVNKEKGW